MRKINLFILLSFFCFSVSAQEKTKITFPSPEVYSFNKFGEHPVSLMTGTPSISIPVFKIIEGDLQENITLSYHAGGIKVNEVASWVGLGWNLNVGGFISRSVRGGVDGRDPFSNQYPTLFSAGLLNEVGAQTQLTHELADGRKDREPDLFSYNFSGKTGKFVIDRYGIPRLLPNQNLKIELVGNNINEFVITDEKGAKYFFGQNDVCEYQKQYIYTTSDWTQRYRATWFLTRVESANGQDYINYSYTPSDRIYYQVASEVVLISGECTTSPESPLNKQFAKIEDRGYVLSGIESNKFFIEFNSSQDRLDIDDGFKLNDIVIKNKKLESIKKINLKTSYFNCPNAGSPHYKHTPIYNLRNYDTYRLRLDSVQEYNGLLPELGGVDFNPPYVFSYFEGVSLPRRLSFAQDKGGYYNGISNRTLLPKIPEFANCNFYNQLASRNVKWPEAKAFVLEQIKYPTGGETNFIFEPNKKAVAIVSPTYILDDYLTSSAVDGECYEDDIGTVLTTTSNIFNLSTTTSLSINSSPCTDGQDYWYDEYYKVELFNITQGTSEVEKFYTDGYGRLDEDISLQIFAPYSPNDDIQITITLNTETEGIGGSILLTENDVFQNQLIDAPGIRLKEKITSSNGAEPQITHYDYHWSGEDSGFNPIYLSLVRKSSGSLLNGTGIWQCPGSGSVIKQFSSYPEISSLNFSGSYIAYSEVSEIIEGNGKTTTTFHLGENYGWFLPGLGDDFPRLDILKGAEISKIVYNNNNLILKTENEYVTSDKLVLGLEGPLKNMEATKTVEYSRLSAGCIINLDNVDVVPSYFDYNMLVTKITNRVTKTTEYFSSGNLITNTETLFESEYHNLPTKTINYDSRGNKLISKTTYSLDLRFDLCDQNLTSTISNIQQDFGIGAPTSYTFSYWRNEFTNNKSAILDAFSTYNACMSSGYTLAGNSMKVIKKMHDQNIIKPIETLNYIAYKTGVNTWGSENVISAFYFEYIDNNDVIKLNSTYKLPFITPLDTTIFSSVSVDNSSGFTIIKDNRYESVITYKYFEGRLVEVKRENGTPTVYLWSYDNQYPVAEIVGKSYDAITTAMGATFMTSLKNESVQNAIETYLNTLRNNTALSDVFIKTYSYKNGVGINEIKDERNRKLTYKYDELGRLVEVKDTDGNILSKNEYNYKNN